MVDSSFYVRRSRGEVKMAVVPEISEDVCDGCGDCVDACHASAVELINNKAKIVRPEDCDYCAECEEICPSDAISCYFDIVLGVRS